MQLRRGPHTQAGERARCHHGGILISALYADIAWMPTACWRLSAGAYHS